MPFAQWGYPHVPGSAEAFAEQYPAQFICEALDQTRGWFYSLMAVGTLLFDQSSYENVVCLGLLLAEDGRKMSKHLGNILEPIPLMDEHGADALRWFMAASGSPWSARRVGHASIQETVRKVLLTYWNTVAFHVLYARTNGWTPHPHDAVPVTERPVLDRWLVSRRNRLVGDDHRRARAIRHPARRATALRVRRRALELVRPPIAPPVLGRRRCRAHDTARDTRRVDPADGADDAVHHRAGVAGPRRLGRRGSARLCAPRRAGRCSTTRSSTRTSTRRWR